MNKQPYIALIIAIIAVSFAAIFIVSMQSPPLTIALYRLLFTSLLLLPIFLFKKTYRQELISIKHTDFILMILIGIILAAHFAFWITSLKLTSIASSVLLVSSHPLIVAPLSILLLKEKLQLTNLTGIGLAITGIFVLIIGNYGFENLTTNTLEGNLLALLGGIAAGLYILGGRKIRKNTSVFSYAFIVYLIATITLIPLCLLYNQPLTLTSTFDYQIVLLMAIVSGIFGHTLYNWTLKYIKASLASVILLGEPIGSTLLAYTIPWINQTPTTITIIGGIIILTGIYLTSLQKRTPQTNMP